MKIVFAAVALLATSAGAAERGPMGEIWYYPAMAQQALAPIAPLAGRVAREGLCPTLKPDGDAVLHTYQVETKMKVRGVGNRRWEVRELRLLNPSGCLMLDTEVEAILRTAIPDFVEPRQDLDKNGWTRLPPIQLRAS